MGIDYFIFYTEASIVCIIILLMILINSRLYSTRQETQICFDHVIVTFILYFISDACWASVLSGQLPRIRMFVVMVNMSNYILLGVVAFEWFTFMAASEKMPFRYNRKKRTLYSLPMRLSFLFMLVSYIIEPAIWFTEDNNPTDLYYPMMIAVPALYLLAAFVISMFNARKTEMRAEKKLYRLIGVFPLGVMAFGMVQVVVLDAPTFCFGCTIMLVFFYIQQMQDLISVDALTRLNNRGQINRYMEQIRFRDNTRVFAMMIDIDRFKQINDTYGHGEGDRALILVSETLKKVCEGRKTPVFLGRYGGDEFSLILQNPGETEMPGPTCEAIRSSLAEAQWNNRLPYNIEVSIGYDELRDKEDTLEACLARADAKLYEEKRRKGNVR